MAGMLDANMGGLGALFSAGDKAAGSDYDPAANMMKALSLAQGITQYKQAAEDRAAMKEYFASGGEKSSPDGVSSIFRLMGAARRFAGQNPELAKKYQEMALAQLQSVKDSGDITTYNYVLNRLTGVNASLAGDPRAWKEGTDQFGRAVLRGATPDAAGMGEAVIGQNKIDPDQAIALAGKIASENGVSINAALDAMSTDPRLAPFAAVALKSIAEKQQNVALGPDMTVTQMNPVASVFGRGAGTPGRLAAPGMSTPGRLTAPGAGTPGRAATPGASTGNADLSLLVDAANKGKTPFVTRDGSGAMRQNSAMAGEALTHANKTKMQEEALTQQPLENAAFNLAVNFKPEVFTMQGMAKRGVNYVGAKLDMLPAKERKEYAERERYIVSLKDNFREIMVRTGGKALTPAEMELVNTVVPNLDDDPVRAWEKITRMSLLTAEAQRRKGDILAGKTTIGEILQTGGGERAQKAQRELYRWTTPEMLKKIQSEKYPGQSLESIRSSLVKKYLDDFRAGKI